MEALGQLVDERADLRPRRRFDHGLFANPRVAQCNVGRDVAGKEKHILQHQT